MLKPFFVSSLLCCLSTLTMFAQTSPASDSTTIRWEGKWSTPKERFQPIPKKAIMYSAILPGLGQVYNRQYWKVPIIYAGMAAAFIAYDFNSSRYETYKKAYIARIDNNPSRKDCALVLDSFPPSISFNLFKSLSACLRFLSTGS